MSVVHHGRSTIARRALCQDCLAANAYTSFKDGTCRRCGGETCGCTFCTGGLDALLAGETEADRVGCQTDVVAWTPEHGELDS